MTKLRTNKKKGSIDRSETFDACLAGEGLLAETEDAAIKEIIADQIKVTVDRQDPSKTEMVRRGRHERH